MLENLYHFTGIGHIANILYDGHIKAHTDRLRPDPFAWFTSNESGDRRIGSQPFPLARITMKPGFGAVKFDRVKHWEELQTKEYIANMDRGLQIHGYTESDWFVHEGNVDTSHIASIDMKRTRMTPWESIDLKVLRREANPQGTFFELNGLTFVQLATGKHEVDGVPGKQGWALARTWDYGTPTERIIFVMKSEILFMPDAQLKKLPVKEMA